MRRSAPDREGESLLDALARRPDRQSRPASIVAEITAHLRHPIDYPLTPRPMTDPLRAPSPFLALPASVHVAGNALAFAVRDKYAVSPGHTLVIPRRLVPTWFDATPEEQRALFALVDEVKRQLDAGSPRPDGYNVGFNAGEAAGQTVMHLHVHVIPRYAGDVEDPRGGVRHVMPGKGNYLAPAPPSPRGPDPVFIEKLLSLLDEGRFTTTYKFAVMLGLMDLCLEHTSATGEAPVSVSTMQLAEKVLAQYWAQATTFPAGAGVLRQNSDPTKPALLLTRIVEFRRLHAPDPSASLQRARTTAPDEFKRLLREVEWTLIDMPLPRLQRFGGRADEEDAFLYAISWSQREPVRRGDFSRGAFDNSVRFMPGAAEQLAVLATMLRPVVQRRWAAKVAQYNGSVVQDAYLEDFLFGADRISLAPVREHLLELHDGRCFYCDAPIAANAQVDHFIAWARHPDNRLDNLVPAHARCNESKSDHLAASAHVERWLHRSSRRDSDLDEIARRAKWDRCPDETLGVGRGLYLRLRDGVRLWLGRDHFERAESQVVRRLFETG